MLEKSKMRFGPYALQLAEEFFNKQMRQIEVKIDPSKRDEQEKISYVKMEYFLYGIAEADRIIEQLKSMEIRMNTLAQEADRKFTEAEELAPGLSGAGYAMHQANYREERLRE